MSNLKPIESIDYVNPRARQQSLVDMLTELRDAADSGEVVGMLCLWIDKDGTWHHKRDMFQQDIPAIIGYCELTKHKMVNDYLYEAD